MERSSKARCIMAALSVPPEIIAGLASRQRSHCVWAKTCRRVAAADPGATAPPAQLRAAWRRSNCLRICRHDYKRLSAAAMVAGNVLNAGSVVGTSVSDWRRFDLAQLTARLLINGREIGTGKGGDVMGNPLHALAWLAESRAVAGTPLRRGTIVMTGSMVPIQFPSAGDRAIVEVEGLGSA